jgi:hypothetical protein
VENLDDNLKQLMKELGAAINDTLSNSEKISEAIARIRSSTGAAVSAAAFDAFGPSRCSKHATRQTPGTTAVTVKW